MKKEPKPKLFGPDIFGCGGGLPREWVGAKKFGMSFETQESQTFWRDIPGIFCRDIPRVPEKFDLVDVSDLFKFFFCFGGGKGRRSPRRKGGGDFLFKNGEGGRVAEEGRQGGEHWGWEGVAGRRGG